MELNESIVNLIREFEKIDDVEGILLAGSQASGTNDINSDYDIYVYTSKAIEVCRRKEICDKYFKYIELDNKFWETEDDGILKNDIPVEIIYRDISWIKGCMDKLLVRFEADTGYTTCFWSNLVNSIILYDKNGRLKDLQDKCKVSYPEELKENIIQKNYPLLKKQMPAYYHQIEKALKRSDLISVNHRVAAFFASYFDIIFAMNEFLHPGEKKILKIIKENNLKVPNDMESNVLNILKYTSNNTESVLKEIDLLISNLDELLDQEGIEH